MSSPAARALDPRLPVIIGVGQLNVRVDRGEDPVEPVEMVAEVARRAASDSGARDPGGLLAGLDTIGVIPILSWRYSDPAALVADRVGADPRRRWTAAFGGNFPQTMLNRAAVDISRGDADLVLIGGAEAWRSRNQARAEAQDLGWSSQDAAAAPTERFGADTPMSHPDEVAMGLMLPVTLYAIFESAVRAASGRSPAEHTEAVAQLWSRFSEVAASNPNAWITSPRTAAEIGTASPDNRMISHPYPKLMSANNSVEQSAGFIVASVERARALGVPEDRWVFPWVGTDASDAWYVGNRVSLHRSPAMGIAGGEALRRAGLGIDDVAHVDIYSCFPSAVQVAAAELGIGLDRQLTVTGGLSFAGGPWNNYVSHSIAAMVDVLRADAGSAGLVTANGGYLTKHSFGVLSTEPPPRGAFSHRDCQAEVDDVGSVELASGHEGAVRIEGATVSHDRDGTPQKAFVAVRTPQRDRAWAVSTDPAVIRLVTEDEPVGVAAHRAADGTLQI